MRLATPPGGSNHETGLALDIAEAGRWRATLEARDFRWLGSADPVHFDYTAGRATTRPIDVIAFQRLWNRNHPGDVIAEHGKYDSATEVRLESSPAAGFPLGAHCDRESGGRAVNAGSAN